MKWFLWLDDQASDPLTPARHAPFKSYFKVAHNVDEAKKLVEEFGVPEYMDLDHDLADGKDCMAFLYWLEESLYKDNSECQIGRPPKWNIHSRNPVGRENIDSWMKSWKKIYDEQFAEN